MADTGVQYRYQAMKVVRGREARTIVKMQNEGWELHAQDQGRLRTTITFRRVKKPTPWRRIAAIAVAAVVIAVVGGIAALQSRDDASRAATDTPSEGPSETPSENTPTPSEGPSEEPTATQAEAMPPTLTEPPASTGDETLTVDNNPDLKRLLTTGQDDDLSQAFSKAYEGRKIEFDGNVANTMPHGDYDTRFDFLVFAGDFSETVANPGPSFQYRDVNFYDLNLRGGGSSVGTGDNLHIVAEVGAFEVRTGLFLLEPVATRLR